MVPRPPFSKLVLRKIKTMMDRRSVDVISGNFSDIHVRSFSTLPSIEMLFSKISDQ